MRTALPLAVCGEPPTRTWTFSPVVSHQPIVPSRGFSATYVQDGEGRGNWTHQDTCWLLTPAIGNRLKTLIGFSPVSRGGLCHCPSQRRSLQEAAEGSMTTSPVSQMTLSSDYGTSSKKKKKEQSPRENKVFLKTKCSL